MRANEKSVESRGAKLCEIIIRPQTGFAHRDTIFGNAAD